MEKYGHNTTLYKYVILDFEWNEEFICLIAMYVLIF